MNILIGNEKYNEAFLNSLDNISSWEQMEVYIEEEINVMAKINTKKWDDGAPVMKYFYKNASKRKITLKGNYKIIVDHEDEYAYIYSDGVWYEFDFAFINYYVI